MVKFTSFSFSHTVSLLMSPTEVQDINISISLEMKILIITEYGGRDQSLTDVVPGDGDQHTELSHDLARAEEDLQSTVRTLRMEEIMIGDGPGDISSGRGNFTMLTYRVTLSQARTVTASRNRSKFSSWLSAWWS